MSEADIAACDRWAEIADRHLIGEAVSEEDTAFLREHEQACELCRAEAAAWADLERSGREDSLSDPAANELVERVLGSAPADKKMPLARPGPSFAKKLPLRRPARVAGAVATGLALAAAVALLVRGRDAELPTVAELSSASGGVEVDGRPAAAGSPLALGARIRVPAGSQACIGFDGGRVRSCLDSDSELQITRADGKSRVLALARGTVVSALDKLPTGHTFSIAVARGEVQVTGTVFSVSERGDGAALVRVHEGSVHLQTLAKDGPNVGAGHEVDFGRSQARAVATADRDRELALVGVRLPRGGETARIDPPPSAETPVAPAAPDPALPSSTAAPEASAKPPSAAEMLTAARTLRASGNAAGAAEAYRRLMATHPKSAESHAALVSLAELELGPLGNPAGALRSYDAYLRSGGGALTQEARYGRIQALRRLGRAAEERSAIEEFVSAYPNSVQARALRARIGEPSDATP